MKVTEIGHLTIYRPANIEELKTKWSPDTKYPGVIFTSADLDDETTLARISCMGLIDDEKSSQAANKAHTIVIVPGSCPAGKFMLPPQACVAKKIRSIRARQAAIASGVADPATPLVGAPVPTRT
jgi:hypothetical protein